MAPKKAMKSMKALEKASGKALAKASKVKKHTLKIVKAKAYPKKKPLEKGKEHHPKNKLNKTNLEKLGHMSLQDKVKQATEEGETSEEQAEALKKKLSKDEHSKVWGRYQTHLNSKPEEKAEIDMLPKKLKGLKAAQWLMEREGKNTSMSRRVRRPNKLSAREMFGKATKHCLTDLVKTSWKPTSGQEG